MNDLLLQVIVIAIIANLVLMLIALVGPRLRRAIRRAPASGSSLTMAPAGSVAALSGGDAMLLTSGPYDSGAATLDDLDDVSRDGPDDETRDEPPMEPEPMTLPPPTDATSEPWASERVDPTTGLITGVAFDELVRLEDGRLARYGRPATVVVCELDRLDALATRIGRENADRLIPPVAAVLHRQARTPDLVARIDRSRFHVLLPETDEVQAIHYVERVRESCDVWLEAAAISVRLVMGWASATSGGSLRDALRVAEQRMHAERARGSAIRTPLDDGPTAA